MIMDDFVDGCKSSNNLSPPKVILISYDGFRWDYIYRNNNTPTFRWLIKNGAYATEGLKNTFITITAPNHYGIVTGLYEESHGIIANSFFDPVLNKTFDYFNTRCNTDPAFFAYLLNRLAQEGLLNEVNLIFTADHGMAAVPYDNVVDVDRYISKSWYTLSGGSPNWNILPKPGVLPIQLYADIHWRLANNDTVSSLTAEQQLLIKNPSRKVKITIRGKDHWVLLYNNTVGQHGYNNSLPDMHPYFIGYGPAFRKGYKIKQFLNLDIYPLMCNILGVTCAPNNGSFERVKNILNPVSKHQDRSRKLMQLDYSKYPGFKYSYGVEIDVLAMFLLVVLYILGSTLLLKSLKSAESKHKVDSSILFHFEGSSYDDCAKRLLSSQPALK